MRENNLTASRFNSRTYRHNIVSEDLYKRWKKDTGRKESFKQFKDIWHMIANTSLQLITQERDGIRLPKGLGDIYMGYVPSARKEFIDYKASAQYGKIIKHQNWDTNGKPGKIIHGTRDRKYIFKLYKWWSLKCCRNFTRTVMRSFKENPERYKNSIEKRYNAANTDKGGINITS